MSVAYVDTSVLAAILLGERGSERWAKELAARPHLLSSNLLEAELRAALRREQRSEDPTEHLAAIDWVLPDRELSAEIARVLATGPLRGADLWHLANALYVAPDPTQMAFLTLDTAQDRARAELGFAGWDSP